jgi:DNA-directed RNA polymerase specialized sigma24 family protein
LREGVDDEIGDDRAGSEADHALTALYSDHCRSLVRAAALLAGDAAMAEVVVRDSFVAMHAAWKQLGDDDHALEYLYRSVVWRSRRARRRTAATRLVSGSGASPAGLVKDIQPPRSVPAPMLRNLPARQREVLVLRYYAGLSDAQIASAMSVTTRTVGRLATRALSSLHTELPSSAD